MKRRYGWRPQLSDQRDFAYRSHVDSGVIPPSVAPLTNNIQPAWDQGELGSCTAHGNGALWAYRMQKEGRPFVMPSRLFIYYCERSIEGTVKSDAGAAVRDGLKAMAKWGVPPESDWPYNVGKFAQKPPARAYYDATKDVALSYNAVRKNLVSILAALASGDPVVFGFTVYESFESPEVAATGVMPMPAPGERVLGGHCVLFDGYDLTPDRESFWCRNSWGPGWGIGGWFRMPFDYLPHCSDFWTLLKVK